MEHEDFRTILLGEVIVCARTGDQVLDAILLDPRAEEVAFEQAAPRWTGNDIDHEAAYIESRGIGPFGLAALHYWRHGVDFDYVDVGANVGLTVCVEAIFHKRAGRVVICHAFEPGTVHDMLRNTVAANGLRDVVVCNRSAASDETGSALFHVPPVHSAASSLLSSATTRYDIPAAEAVSVPTIRLEDYDANLRDVPGRLVKIDAEGADIRIVSGMGRVLEDRLCTILIEFTPKLIREYADPVEALHALTEGFLLIDDDDRGRRPILSDRAWIAAFVTEVEANARGMTDVLLISKRVPDAVDLYGRILVG